MRALWQLIGSPALCSTFNHGFLYFREGKEVRRFTVSILTLKKLLVQVGLFLFAMMLITDNSLQTVLFHCMRCVLSGIFITLHCVPYEISAFFIQTKRESFHYSEYFRLQWWIAHGARAACDPLPTKSIVRKTERRLFKIVGFVAHNANVNELNT